MCIRDSLWRLRRHSAWRGAVASTAFGRWPRRACAGRLGPDPRPGEARRGALPPLCVAAARGVPPQA
eukprot:2895181-Alexandrium_andersonii.AAC.1